MVMVVEREPQDSSTLPGGEVGVLINTNMRFLNTTVPRLVGSLLASGWPAHLIHIVVGG
jgi:hypothetical protein